MDVTTADISVSTNHAITLQYRMFNKILEIVLGLYNLIQFQFFYKIIEVSLIAVPKFTRRISEPDIIKEYTLIQYLETC